MRTFLPAARRPAIKFLFALGALAAISGAQTTHLDSGIRLFKQRDLQAAAREFRSCADADPGNATCWYWLGEANLSAGRYNDAAADLQRSVNLQADFAPAYRSLGLAALQLGEFSRAYQSWRVAVSLDPKDIKSKYYLGRLLLQADKPAGAAEWLRKAATEMPDDVEVTTFLALAEERTGNATQAVQLLQKAISIGEQRHTPLPVTYIALADHLRREGKDRGAEQVLERQAELCPDPVGLVALAEARSREKRAAEAESLLRSAIQMNAGFAPAHYKLGLLLQASGRTDEARLEMQRFNATKAEPRVVAIDGLN
ncbi:MAG TPA: tetratricopeptide repeat protein [Bryobacteraceae bacterium]|jgi:tetratricopeptide (TPR) repeat protein|nr:tetratricopeptide repeat protein [Bryobacteraceae bacterium]